MLRLDNLKVGKELSGSQLSDLIYVVGSPMQIYPSETLAYRT